jgi:signal peptidase I
MSSPRVSATSWSTVTKRPRKRHSLWATVALNTFVALLTVSLVQAFLVKLYRIPSGSMEETLQSNDAGGDRILVNRLSYLGGVSPEPGDIVVFNRPANWTAEAQKAAPGGPAFVMRAFGDITGIGPSNDDYLVKRVVARGGQTIACCDAQGHLELNGQGIDEPHVFQDPPFEAGSLDCTTTPRSTRCFGPFSVEEGQLVLLGDHRSMSADSAIACRNGAHESSCMRTVSVNSVVGHVFARIWPFNRIGFIE